MRLKRNIWVLLMAAVLASGAGAQAVAPAITEKLQGFGLDVASKPVDPVEFELRALNGGSVKLSSLKGKVVFLNLWATWCGPCRSEMPSMQRTYQTLKDEGLEILAVDLMEDQQTVQKFARDLKLSFPILLDSTGAVGGQYGARAIPTTYLLDRQGKIFARAVGARQWDTPEMEELLRQVLRQGGK